MQYTLGCLADEKDESMIGFTLETLSDGIRHLLHTKEVVEPSGKSGYNFRFTEFGREVAQACYKKHEGYICYKRSELEATKARRAARRLPEKLQRSLAVLSGSSEQDAAVTLILMSRTDKRRLQEVGAVELIEQGDDIYARFTAKGRRIMSACSYLQGPEWVKQACDEFARERREYWETRFRNPTRVHVVSTEQK
ncbi:MAG TPA: hypothetical protein VLF88_03655 [Candidatus Babeliales bacterium]|nr:hypothetical protein [Candidatus Babeliales bacterium]